MCASQCVFVCAITWFQTERGHCQTERNTRRDRKGPSVRCEATCRVIVPSESRRRFNNTAEASPRSGRCRVRVGRTVSARQPLCGHGAYLFFVALTRQWAGRKELCRAIEPSAKIIGGREVFQGSAQQLARFSHCFRGSSSSTSPMVGIKPPRSSRMSATVVSFHNGSC